MAEKKQARKVSRRRDADAAKLTELKARRDRLDADQADRQRREDAALARYVKGLQVAESAYKDAEHKAAALERQAEDVRAKARQEAADGEAEQAAALAELKQLGRSADNLAQMTGLSARRIRTLFKIAGQQTVTSPSEEAPPAADQSPPAPDEQKSPATSATAEQLATDK